MRLSDLRHDGTPLRCSGRRRRRPWLDIAIACVLLAVFAVDARALDRPRMFADYTLTSWTDEDGLFGGWIVGIAQDHHGYLWIGTVSGLVRFDGVTFEDYRPSDGTRLPQRSPSTVATGSDGSIWVGYSGNGGVYRIQDGRVTAYGPSDGLGRGRVTALLQDVDGAMLAATRDGFYRLSGRHWKQVSLGEGSPDERVETAYRDGAGALWVGTRAGIFVRKPGQEVFEAVEFPVRYAPSFGDSPDGTIWITDPRRGFVRLKPTGGPARIVSPRRGTAPAGSGYRLLHDRLGNLWVATLDKGLWFVRRDGRVASPEVITVHDGLSNDSVRVLFEDRDGAVWVGTTGGLHRFARRRVTAIADLGVVRAVAAVPDGGVWVGTADGLVRLSSGGRQWFGVTEGLPSADVRALHVDRFGNLWVVTAAGIGLFADGKFTRMPSEGGISWPSGIFILTTDAAGAPWVSSDGQGLFGWRNGRLVSVGTSAPLDGEAVAAIEGDSQGRLWLITQGGGLGYLDPSGRHHPVRRSDDFHRSDLAVYEDASGTLWFGGGDRLSRFQDGKLDAIDRANGLPVEAIRAIVGDAQGYLWIGTSAGIIRLATVEFERALADPNRPLEWRAYDSADGLAGMPVRTGHRNAVRSSDGRLWFVTHNGLTVIEPQRLASSRPAPAVRVERVVANGRTFEPAAAVPLPPRTPNVEIDYTALAFSSPRQVRFRHRLEGLDDEWIDAGTRRQVSYTNLPPGTYRFHVMARSSEGIWNEQGDSVSFSVAPAFYQTRSFLASCIAGAMAALFIGWRLRLRHVHREFALVLSERSRMAREIHDTLLQSLAGLELQVDVMSSQLDASPGPVKQQLERVRRQIQRDVSEARQSIWNLRSPTLETRDLPSALRELGESVAASSRIGVEFRLTGSPCPCAPKVEEHLLRIGREALSNAVRHAQATVVRIELEYQPDAIVLRVSDDGRGFDLVEATRADGHHWGLKTMQERAEAIGGQLKLISQPGTGTALEMIAPVMSPLPT